MIKWILFCSLFFLLLTVTAIMYRLVKGPTAPERVQALDALSTNIIAGVAIFSVLLRNTAFFELILLIGILSFIGTIAFGKFIERGVIIERK
ncbi:monovalent cation/H+ antiporter complex subunit F [Desulfofalx alkaliphila]|uniref:monovalent cation/H+ antiporter complex subunit F n=1 Tax=Desulfofalx alkaliphila TaxID=105483 RepID=UPI0004E2203C|nr:monovalent cation/H+ antiporter complex subunit F [Desulfofalx alkaliphila]